MTDLMVKEPSWPLAVFPSRARRTQLVLGQLDQVLVRVESPPLVSLTSVVLDVIGGPRQGVPRSWATAVRRMLPLRDVAAVAPQVQGGLLPDCLTPTTALSVDEQLEQIADLDPQELAADIEEILPDRPPMSWFEVLRRPRRWLDHYTTVMTAAWRAYRPIWAHSAPLRARETERLGLAAVTGGLDVVLATLARRTSYADGVLHLPDPLPYQVGLGNRPLVLVPLVSGATASVFNLDQPDMAWVGYPISGFQRDEVPAPLAGDALAVLMGPTRAALLRELRRPMIMGQLARLTEVSPSQATYHCSQLAAAGLVERTRSGQTVRIKRTPRGDAFLDLLS